MLQKADISPPKWTWLWSRDCFKILPFAVMRVRPRQLSYLWFKRQLKRT